MPEDEAPDIEEGLADGTYREADEPRLSGGVDANGEYINASYYVPFVHRNAFIHKIMSLSRWEGDISGMWAISVPFECPHANGLYAFASRWESLGELVIGSSPVTYSDVRVDVQYRPLMFSTGSGGGFLDPYYMQSVTTDPEENAAMIWATQEVEHSTEAYQVPNGALVFSDEPDVEVGAPQHVEVAILDVYITFHRVPYLPRWLFYLADQDVNDRTFLGFGPGRVRFVGFTTQLTTWVGGFRTRTVRMHFRVRSQSWNRMLDASGNWRLVQGRNGEEPYKLSDFRPLLRFFN